MNCNTLQQGQLVDYLAGMLDETARQEVERHLAVCARCKAEAESMGATVSALRHGLASRRDAAPRLDAARRRDILHAGRGKRPAVTRTSTWWVRSQPLLNVAAILVLTFVCVGLLMPAMSGSRKQSSIRAARAREAQRQVEVELARVEEKAGEDMAGAGASKPQSSLSIEALVEAPSDALADRGAIVADSPVERETAVRQTGLIAQDKTRPGSMNDNRSQHRPVAESLRDSVGTAQQFRYRENSVRGAMPAEESKKEDSINGVATITFGRREGGSRKMALRAYGGGGAQVAQSEPMAAGAAKAESDDYAVKGLSSERAGEKKYKAVALDETGRTAGFAAGDDTEERVQEMAAAKLASASAPGAAAESPLAMPAVPQPTPAPSREGKEAGAPSQEGIVSGGTDGKLAAAKADEEQTAAERNELVQAQREQNEVVREELVEKPMEEPMPVYGQEVEAAKNPFSTFSIDVDTASFTRSRQFLLSGKMPPPGAVRVEEFVNAFEYDYPSPDRRAFAVYADRSRSPFRAPLELLRIGVRGRVIGRDRQKRSVLTLVIDASGSMSTPDRMDLVKASVRLLVDSMAPEDRISVVTFGSETRLVLEDVRLAEKKAILSALDRIQTSGSTQLEGGMRLGYETAARHFRSGSVNRVLLLSDGVANLGAATAQEILGQVESYRRQGIYCSVFGFGKGPYNDAMLETLADKGDGVYRFLDTAAEARRVFVDDLAANLHVIARDVKIQVEFDPRRVKTYRQLGYENRALTREQFRDDTVDAGEVGSGQSVTALYEIRVQGPAAEPLGMVRVRWMDPETGKVEELEQALRVSDRYGDFDTAPARFRLAAAAAELADRLRGHPVAAGTDWSDVERVVRAVGLELPLDQRVADLVRMVTAARNMGK